MQDNVLAHDWSIIPGLINHNPRINPIMEISKEIEAETNWVDSWISP